MPVIIRKGLKGDRLVKTFFPNAASKSFGSFCASFNACTTGRQYRASAAMPTAVVNKWYFGLPNFQNNSTKIKQKKTQQNSVTKIETYQSKLVGARNRTRKENKNRRPTRISLVMRLN